MTLIPWSELYRNRQLVKKRYPTIWSVPIIKKETERLLALIRPGQRILEVGAGDRRFGDLLIRTIENLEYRSFDIDRNTRQDYYCLSEIEGDFDCIFAFEFIEHVSPTEGLDLLRFFRQRLRAGGKLLLGTPNLYHPHRYWGDITHQTPYKYEELGGLMMIAGFNLPTVYRIYNASWPWRWLRLHVGVWLHRYLDVDFAHTVILETELDS